MNIPFNATNCQLQIFLYNNMLFVFYAYDLKRNSSNPLGNKQFSETTGFSCPIGQYKNMGHPVDTYVCLSAAH